MSSYDGVSRDDMVLGNGGGCTIYQRADGSYYALDDRGGKCERSGSRVSGPAKFDTRELWARNNGHPY